MRSIISRRTFLYKALASVTALILMATSIAYGQVHSLRADPGFPFKVTITGQGPAVYLIPGLACSGEVWNTTVAHLKSKFKCYVFTLDGFGGAPATHDSPFLKSEVKAIERYTTENKINHPIVIGHSLGGFLAWWLAIDQPKMWKAIVAVDGVPYIGALQNSKMTVEDNRATALKISKLYSKMDKKQFESGTEMALSQEITDPKNVAFVLRTAKLSDPTTVGEAFKEMMLTDLRLGLKLVKCPALQYMSAAFYVAPANLKLAEASYKDQIKLCKGAHLEVAKKARHFIFLDDPEFFFKTLDKFLSKLPKS